MNLDDIIKDRIPQALLERVVHDQADLTQAQRDALFKASGLSVKQIAQRVVAEYGVHSSKLAWGLYDQVHGTDYDTARLLLEHLKKAPGQSYGNHQASLVGSIPTLPLSQLSSFLEEVKGQVCLIMIRKGQTGTVGCGTGFLVAPDLVLTCRHVFKDFKKDEDMLADGNRIELYFDFLLGEPVKRFGLTLPGVRKVGLHSQWYVESRDHADPDGMTGELSPEEMTRITGALDFLLLRLDQKVGFQPLQQGGGRRRRWIDFPPNAIPQNLQALDWIIIPQHPGGFPQRIDLGRYKESDPTSTRIRYNTNTAHGTSGAPCFNQDFHLVGVHNAYVGPEAKPLANQAIRVDHISNIVSSFITPQDKQQRKTFIHSWSISRDNKAPRVILGRERLLQWLEKSTTSAPSTLSDRVYVAKADVGGAGCTFSSEVLHAEIRGTKTPRAVYGSGGQQMPSTVEDFIRSLLRELGIDLEKMNPKPQKLPQRPGKTEGEEAAQPLIGEVDKINRWISDELPTWLNGVITAHVEKVVDARLAAKHTVEYLTQQEMTVPEELTKQADSDQPIPIRPNPWDYAYVIVDELRSQKYQGKGAHTKMTEEIQSLIAALVKGKPEAAMPPGLRRLRWMFLGYLPDFIRAAEPAIDGAWVEILQPKVVGEKECLEVFQRMANAHLQLSEGIVVAKGTIKYIVKAAEKRGTSVSWLTALQEEVNEWSANLLSVVEN